MNFHSNLLSYFAYGKLWLLYMNRKRVKNSKKHKKLYQKNCHIIREVYYNTFPSLVSKCKNWNTPCWCCALLWYSLLFSRPFFSLVIWNISRKIDSKRAYEPVIGRPKFINYNAFWLVASPLSIYAISIQHGFLFHLFVNILLRCPFSVSKQTKNPARCMFISSILHVETAIRMPFC